MGNTKMCLGIIHLYGKKANKEEKKNQRTKVQGPIPDLTSSILYLSCCVFNIIRLELKHEST